MARPARASRVLATLAFAASACVPRGDAPAGRQLLADRTATLVGLLPATGDGVLRALFLRPGEGSDSDLYVLSVDAAAAQPSERLLLAGVPAIFELGCPRAGGRCPSLDSRGRLYVSRPVGGDTWAAEIFRIDPVTGEALSLGRSAGLSLSAGGERVLISRDSGNHVLYEDDGSATTFEAAPPVFGGAKPPVFVGSVVFYQTTQGDLMRIPSGGAPERVATAISSFTAIAESLLVLLRPTAEPDVATQSLLDPATLEETALPASLDCQRGVSLSPDGRWIVAGAAGGGTIGQAAPIPGGPLLFDRLTGTVETLDRYFERGSWRPGHAELWTSYYDGTIPDERSASSVLIKRPGEPPVVMPGVYLDFLPEEWGQGSPFTSDGAYWFSRGNPISEAAISDLVGSADDPAGPRFELVPAGRTARQYWRLADGRLLVQIYTKLDDIFENFDVQATDPRTGAAQPLGERGYVIAVGQTRILGIFHVIYERGDLTTVDLDSGQSTVLAREYAMAAFAERQETDPYPPGGRVVYQFRARFDSPFDGIWLATVP